MAKKKQWFYYAELSLHEWCVRENLNIALLKRSEGLNKLVSEYDVWPKSGGAATGITFIADRVTSTHWMCHVVKDGKIISL